MRFVRGMRKDYPERPQPSILDLSPFPTYPLFRPNIGPIPFSDPPVDSEKRVGLVEHTAAPALEIRGNLPWFNFLNSPTTWNPQDYMTFFERMSRQKANLIMFHAYDHEPFCGYDITDTKVTMGGPLMTTISEFRWWSPHAMSTKDHLFGTDLFFDRGEWGCEVGIEDAWTFAPGRATRLQQQMMVDALAFARSRGIQTCLGFEVSGDPLDEKVRADLRKRITYVLQKYPLDYLGIWQAEHLGVRGATGAEEDADKGDDADELWKAFAYFDDVKHKAEGVRMARHVRFAHEVMREVKPDVRMVVSGWGGDQHMKFTSYYVGLDRVVDKDIIFAALDNIDPRSADHVSEVYGKLSEGRERWPIPWFESDAGHTRIDQTGPQTNVTAFEPLLKDIVAKKCEGALGIHWRTRNVEDVAGYLYRFAWNPELTAAGFFKQYARDHYGPDDADHMAKVHLRLEEFGPQYVGARGTTECASKGFSWFRGGKGPLLNHGPNLAGARPDEARLPELEEIATDCLARSEKAVDEGRHHSARQYHDLAKTIEWLVIRARVGMAIWGKDAPLEERLREAERLSEQGQWEKPAVMALSISMELQKLGFRGAMQALASTCRTRGELGMLATANARYGRYYATFVQRLSRVMRVPMPELLDRGEWTGPEVLTVFPVPNYVSVGQAVSYDAVLLPARKDAEYSIELTDPSGARWYTTLKHHGGAYYRTAGIELRDGTTAWRLVRTNGYEPKPAEPGAPEGVLTVGTGQAER